MSDDPNFDDDVEILTELRRRGVAVHVLDPSPELIAALAPCEHGEVKADCVQCSLWATWGGINAEIESEERKP
jgi:hypothetical protein